MLLYHLIESHPIKYDDSVYYLLLGEYDFGFHNPHPAKCHILIRKDEMGRWRAMVAEIGIRGIYKQKNFDKAVKAMLLDFEDHTRTAMKHNDKYFPNQAITYCGAIKDHQVLRLINKLCSEKNYQ